MAFLIPILVGAVGTLVVLRWVAHVRGARLRSLIRLEEAGWMALCRVTAEGRFLDDGRRRRGGGPEGRWYLCLTGWSGDRIVTSCDLATSQGRGSPKKWRAWRVGSGGISQVCGLHRPVSACPKAS